MRRILTALTLTVLVWPCAHADVYRWVDDDGHVHFSDEPRDGASRMEIPEPTVVPSTSVPDRPAQGQAADAQAAPDWQVRIQSPAPEATVRDNSGRLSVSVGVEPELGPGQSVELLMDGERAPGGPFAGGQIELTGIDRGAHELQAVLRSADGEALDRSEPVTFYMHQASRLHPGRDGSSGNGGNNNGGESGG
ncbi:DUF4124 domain-containing protein [Arhodomonas sp. AD133]|uniref:DUF4124 domain-containing protein n=1 Tax=Arhodomonas sp. AD133 TaxID=3415009 RepID=UPI003EBE68CF